MYNRSRFSSQKTRIHFRDFAEVLYKVRSTMKLSFAIGLFLVLLSQSGLGQNNYSTTFNYTEKPISNGGVWVNGHAAGKAKCKFGIVYCWGDMQTNGAMAYGVDEPTKFGDPTAMLNGTWSKDQTVQGTVHVASAQPTRRNKCCREIELRLRVTIQKGSITGYEAYCSVLPGNPYCHIASWGGPNGAYVNLDDCLTSSPPKYLKEGDVLKATVTGTNPVTLTAFVNGEQIMQVKDTGTCRFSNGKKYGPWVTGNPGIGQYATDGSFDSFGLADFSATDAVQTAEAQR
jgi:hypothetical protein